MIQSSLEPLGRLFGAPLYRCTDAQTAGEQAGAIWVERHEPGNVLGTIRSIQILHEQQHGRRVASILLAPQVADHLATWFDLYEARYPGIRQELTLHPEDPR